MALADHDTGHVDGLGNTKLEDLGLQAALEQTLGGQLKHEIELLLGVVEESVADQAADEGVTLEDAGLVRLRERKEHTGGLTDLGEHELGAPDLALAAKTIFTTELELLVKTLLAERTARGLEGFAVVTPFSGGDHGSTPATQTEKQIRTDKIHDTKQSESCPAKQPPHKNKNHNTNTNITLKKNEP